MKNRFDNQVAVVTGGATGLGKAIAQRIAEEGGHVILFDTNGDLLNATKEQFLVNNLSVETYLVDISQEASVSNAFNKIGTEHKQLHIMVNAAGIVGPTATKITDYPTDAYDAIYNVNLRGAFLMTKYAVSLMEQHRYGRVLLIASIAGKEGNPFMVGYSSMKAGVIGLVKGVGKEYAETGITINGLAPAVIRTAMNENTAPEQLEYMVAKIPMKRLGTVDEVAAMSAWIVSQESSFTTGFVFDISGGRATY